MAKAYSKSVIWFLTIRLNTESSFIQMDEMVLIK